MRIVGGFLEPDDGQVLVGDERMDGRPPNKRPVNTVFQSYALFPHKNVFENVAFPLEVAKVDKAERADRVREMLGLVRLGGFEDRGVGELSGGQAQRVALARALVGDPEVLLLDEPLAALDLKLRKTMQLELRRIHDRLGTTFVYVTHDQEEALAMSDRIVLMNDGRIVQVGDPRSIYDRPVDAFASDFIGEANLIPVRSAGAAEGGLLRLEVQGREVRAEAGAIDASPGRDLMLSLRPERIRIGDGLAANRLEGEIERVIFLGHTVRVLVRIGGDAVITAELPRREGDLLEVGANTGVEWDPGDGVLLEGGVMAET